MAMANSATMLLLRRPIATAAKPAAEVAQKKPGTGHPKKRNVFDVARLLPGWGVGHKVVKAHWKPQTYYKLYDIKLRSEPSLDYRSSLNSTMFGRMPAMELHGAYITKEV